MKMLVCWYKTNDKKSNISPLFSDIQNAIIIKLYWTEIVEIIKIALNKRNYSIIKLYMLCLSSKFSIYCFLYQFFTICTISYSEFLSFFFSLTLSFTFYLTFLRLLFIDNGRWLALFVRYMFRIFSLT